ncbi:glycerophosphodiester phosphodiesterase [Bdellovibrio sp. HCB290]|uniref:glycerophosphodiester phosphodiesterase n=1 Tax=Bdellovibrio sp. HCB290 TaxID=3394356 RepID=UPI0039B63079
MKIMGHRGSRDRAPENTMRSFKALLDSKVTVVEFDIHQTVDGVWVIHHDDTLDRTTTATGPLSSRTWNELSEVRTKEGDALPRLEDVLTLYQDTAMELQIELKSLGDFANLGKILNQNFPLSRITVISFNHQWLHDFKTSNPEIKTTCLLFGLPLNPVEIVRAAKADGISLSVNWIDQSLVQKCHAQKLTVTAWNANDPVVFDKMKSIDVDFLGTDIPFTAMDWI